MVSATQLYQMLGVGDSSVIDGPLRSGSVVFVSLFIIGFISFIVLYIIPHAVVSLSAAGFHYCLSGLFQKSDTAASTENSSIAIITMRSVICTAFYSSQFLLGNLQKGFVVGCGVAQHVCHTT